MATIAHLANFFTPTSGGLRTAINALATEYVRAGHRVHILVPGEREETHGRGRVVQHHLPSVRIPSSGGYRLILRREPVRRLLDEIAPDAVELSDRTTLLHAADWAARAGVPATLIAHERVDGVISAFAPGIPRRALADRMNRTAAARVSAVVCTTQYAATEFERIGVAAHRVPLGVDLRMFEPSRRAPWLRRQFTEPVLLVLASRLSREKRPEFAVDVLDACLAVGLGCRLVVMGQGPLTGAMVRASKGRPMTVLGHVSSRTEVAQVLASADVVLAPGPIETFGLAALEALACGTPVVCHRDSAIPEIVGREAGFAAPLNAHIWAGLVHDVVSGAEGMRDAARRRAELYPWRRSAAAMLEISGLDASALAEVSL